MRAVILYKPDTEFARAVEEFKHDFTARTPYSVELVDVDSPEGSSMAETYDMVQYPSVLAIRDDGQLTKSWSGMPLPLMNEVAGYLVQQ